MLPLHPQDVGIILSYRCQSGCKHCLYNCGPGWESEAMSPGMLRLALETVATWRQRPQVHLTGGEPFLHFSLLLGGVRDAAELDIPCYLETNGAWCTEEADAIRRFAALRDAGLGAVLVSCSPFHAERIPPVRTMRAMRAALEVFGAGRVTVYLANQIDVLRHFGLEHTTPLSRYEEEFGLEGARRILWQSYGLISGGRSGYRLGHLVPGQPPEAFGQETCAGEILYAHHSHFDLYGNFISGFCGGLAVGDWRRLRRILADFQEGRYPPLVGILVERGPSGLFEIARDEYGYLPRTEGYAGKCHLCVDVRRHLAGSGEFLELRPEGFYVNI